MSLVAVHDALIGGGKKLPYDAKVEYLESTGTQWSSSQWIDTGVKASNSTSVQTRVSWPSLNGDYTALGVDNGSTFNGGFNLQLAGPGGSLFRFVRGTQFKDVGISNIGFRPVANTFYDIEIGSMGISVNGTLTAISDTADFVSNLPIPLFAWRRYPNTRHGMAVSIGATKIYDGEKLVRDYQPVRFTNENGQTEGAMYDRVSGQLFRNQGTGSFVLPTA